MRVLTVFGTRPEAVKLAPVIRALQREAGAESSVCVTAQHREMLDQVLHIFQIKPDYDLDLMRPNQSLAEITAAIFQNLDPLLDKLCPDWVLIQGDTSTVVATALLAFYRQIRVGHVEAGLRTGDKRQPFPEEVNRKVAGVIADLHFAPTAENRQNLLNEGIPEKDICITGNPVIDALNIIRAEPEPTEVATLLKELGVSDGKKRLVLITAHRRENFGEPLENICQAIVDLTDRYREQVSFVYPVHLNPHVQGPVYKRLGKIPNLKLLPPLDYLPLVHLMKHAVLVMTDSGGIQEEAPGLGIPTLVLREVTERPEGIAAGTLKLVGTNPERIVSECRRLLDDTAAHQAMARAVNPFGDGHAAERIVSRLLAYPIDK
ncbi:MAG: UDP-N-acetylglucosamine 2-epimerase (non-hydrolyzing) [Anaerolineaceae bacterium]|nr:UDP-N-acetylglucosamine 2-epimerase (non-hydrolyzing) [Anaerolineaceae bacterium]